MAISRPASSNEIFTPSSLAAFSAMFATAGGWWLWTYVLANTSAGMAGLSSLGIPVVAVVASAIQLGETPDALELSGMIAIGVALALLGLIGLRRSAVRPIGAPNEHG
jgi:drug/metabolite transporter (DMT)-like permease